MAPESPYGNETKLRQALLPGFWAFAQASPILVGEKPSTITAAFQLCYHTMPQQTERKEKEPLKKQFQSMVKEAEWIHSRQNALLAAVSRATEEFVMALAKGSHQSMLKCRG